MTAWIETELKLALPDEAAWNWVRSRLGQGKVVEQTNHFLDRSDRAFASARVGIRLRSEGPRRLLSLKGESGQADLEPVTRRIELETAIPTTEFDRALAKGLELAPWIAKWREIRPESGEPDRLELGAFLDESERLSSGMLLERHASFSNRRETIGLTLDDSAGELELEIELDRTTFPGGRIDFEIEVERTSERDGMMTRTHRALSEWLSQEGHIQTSVAESKLARLHAILEMPDDSHSSG